MTETAVITAQPEAPALPKTPGVIGLAVRAALFGAAIVASLIAVIVIVPDKNEYPKAMAAKHERLAAAPGRKIVLVGGSNIPFGVDSARIQNETGCYTVNMGLDAYLGIDYMLAESAPFIGKDDIVVVAPEFDTYVRPPGQPAGLLAGYARYAPAALSYVPLKTRLRVALSIPDIASAKAMRVLDDRMRDLRAFFGDPDTAYYERDAVSNFARFNEYGDEIDHLDAPWPYGLHGIWDLNGLPVDAEVIQLFVDYSNEMRSRGAHVMISHTPVLRSFYEQYKVGIDRIQAALVAQKDLVVPQVPDAYVQDEPMFFDTVYHLNRAGVQVRTATLIEDIKRAFPDQWRCTAATIADTQGDSIQ